MKYFNLLCVVVIAYGIYLFSYHLLLGDLLFHTDIARDFLLIQDVAVNHRFTLIGPRAGGIPGTFFGPIWIYLNLPAFLIGGGNPLVIGYFWLLLTLFGLAVVFYTAKKVFSIEVAIFATTVFIFTILFLAPGFTQSFGPIVVSPILLYTMYLFVEKKRIRYLCWSAVLSGLLNQFQPAFGSIILFLTFVLSLGILIKRRQIRYQLVWFLAFLPLLTYVIFELRHNFLEIRALYTFIFHHNSDAFQQVTYPEVAHNRLEGFLDSINFISINTVVINTFFVLLNFVIVSHWVNSKKSGGKTYILLTYFYLIGFWLITFLFKGTVWNYYYWGLYPLLSIAFGSLFLKIDKRVFIVIFVLLMAVMIPNGYNTVKGWQDGIYAKDTSSWIINKEVADFVYQDATSDFGYYVYSPDNFGYSKKYAMSYIGMTGAYSVKGYLCTKRPTTYIIYESTPPGSHTDPVFWLKASVSIKTKPVWRKQIQTVTIEKYELTPQQVKQPSDPTMICGLEWR